MKVRGQGDRQHVHVHVLVQLGGNGMCWCQFAFIPCDHGSDFALFWFPLTACVWDSLVDARRKVGPPSFSLALVMEQLYFSNLLLCLGEYCILMSWIWCAVLYNCHGANVLFVLNNIY